MIMGRIKTQGQGRIFQNAALEALTKTHPAFIIGLYVPLSGLSLWYCCVYQQATLLLALSLFLAGMIFWTLVEYLLHRYVFHFISESELVQRFHYTVHGVHHEYPMDTERLIMPPVPSVIVVSLFYLLYYAVMGNYVYGFLPGFVMGYLIYASIHYAIHAYKPPKGFQYLWRHHNLHHFKYPDRAFGVSFPFWDMVFGTMPPKEAGSTADTVEEA
jgi:sterol desaturase/sphingolipid hydroxylase (fatty acid hydroxylase superfamily)